MKKKLISLFLLTTLIFNTFIIYVSAAYPTDAEIIAAAADVIVSSEGWYSSVRADDNGAVSIGCIQWHANRALNLLKTIVNANTSAALDILGDALYNEIVTSTSWTTRILTEEEASKVSKLISTPEGIAAQDALLANDIANYVAHGRQLGITSPAALVYFADVENQCGGGGSARVYKAAVALAPDGNVDLDILHQAALADGPAGKFPARRNKVYNYALLLGWEDDLNIPYELWSTTETLNVRTGPGLSYQVTGSIAKGTNVIIYERKAADGYVWGKTTSGWIATDYCSFISGNTTYYASFDVNGGNEFAKPILTLDVDKVNSPTLDSLLQIYTGSFGSTTGTPVTQHEIRVDANGVALNATVNGTGNTPIPEGGFVLNASGDKYTQVSLIVKAGHYISFNQSTMKLEVFENENDYLTAANPVKMGSAIGKLPVPTHSDSSLYFSGWYTDDGTKISYGTTVTLAMTPILKLYAHWSTESGDYLPITYNTDGGVIELPSYDNTLTVTAVNAKRLTNYLVVYDSSYGTTSGTNKYGAEVQVNASGKVISAPFYATGNLEIPEGGFVVSAHDSGTANSNCIALMEKVTLDSYLYFDREKMTLEIYNSYDTFNVARKKVSQGRPIGNLPTVTKEGYVFTGWYDANGALITADSVYTSDMSTTFKAGWELKEEEIVTVTVTLDANGGKLPQNELLATYTANGVNCYRNTDMLVIYDNARGENTLTNSFGVEAIVGADGIVKEIQSYKGKAIIPEGGFVLSGHGKADSWILSNVYVGNTVTFDYETNTVNVYKTATSCELSVTAGHKIGEIPEPTHNLLHFLGWYTADGTLITSDTVSGFMENTTLYAKWSLLGDIDKNGVVDEVDMNHLKYAIKYPPESIPKEYDPNGDGFINLEDYFVLFNILYN